MFYLTYLRRELWRRKRQAVVMAVGLAVGIAFVVIVTALTSGVRTAQGEVLRSLYGVGTDITVMAPASASGPGIGGAVNPEAYAQHFDTLQSLIAGPIPTSQVAAVSRLHGVAAAAGDLILTDTKSTIPAEGVFPPSGFEPPTLLSVVGLDLAGADLGPFTAGRLIAGRSFKATDSIENVAVIDSGYAAAHNLTVGSSVVISKIAFTVVGLVRQSQASNPPNVYIPLGRAQALAQLDGFVNAIFVQASSAASVGAVANEIRALMPAAAVTDSNNLASQISGSLATTENLATSLGTWLALIALLAAFAVAGLLTMAAVSRRAREFGTLKALGWRSSRIVVQLIGESIAIGVVGAALGIGLGFGASSLASRLAPDLSAVVQTSDNTGQGGFGGSLGAGGSFFSGTVGGAMTTISNPSATHTVTIPFSAPVTFGLSLAAVALAIGGSLLAGSVGGLMIGRLSPAAALARLE